VRANLNEEDLCKFDAFIQLIQSVANGTEIERGNSGVWPVHQVNLKLANRSAGTQDREKRNVTLMTVML
jgi:hypothetical protein